MLATDHDAVMCDLAETYHIYDYRALPCATIATLAVGLRDGSRIKMKMADAKLTTTDTMLAAVVDRLSLLVWANSKEAQHGRNRPKSLLEEIYAPKASSEIMRFASSEDFETMRRKIIERG